MMTLLIVQVMANTACITCFMHIIESLFVSRYDGELYQ